MGGFMYYCGSDSGQRDAASIPLFCSDRSCPCEYPCRILDLDYDLPTSKLIKSSIGWAKGCALLALYPLAGCLPIRPQIIYRGVCIIGFQTFLLLPGTSKN